MLYILELFLSLITTIIVIHILLRTTAITRFFGHSSRKNIESRAVPRVGGIAIGLPIFLSFAFAGTVGSGFTGAMVGLIVVFLVGLYDDLKYLGWKSKLAAQVIAVGVALVLLSPRFSGIHIFGSQLLLPPGIMYSGLFLIILTVMNSINLLDGLDGLAAGVTLIILIAYIAWGIAGDHWNMVALALPITGALLGFLRYNIFPAQLMLGDSGSLVLGFAVAIIPLAQQPDTTNLLELSVPIMMLTMPLTDAIRVAMARMISRDHPFLPDRRHLHYKLVEAGLRHDLAVITLYGLTLLYLGLSIISRYFPVYVIISAYIVLLSLTLFLPALLPRLRKIRVLREIYKSLT